MKLNKPTTEQLKATFKGFIAVDQNAVFAVAKAYNGFVISETHYELKDGINADQFVIGEEYDIAGITK